MSSRSRIFGSKRDRVVDDELFDEEFMRQLELLQVIARRLMRGRQRAERKTRKVGSGLEFADHREYSPGDDIRNVDWNVLVRLNQTLVRQYEEDEDLPLRLIVDVSESMAARGGQKLRLAKRIAAALAQQQPPQSGCGHHHPGRVGDRPHSARRGDLIKLWLRLRGCL